MPSQDPLISLGFGALQCTHINLKGMTINSCLQVSFHGPVVRGILAPSVNQCEEALTYNTSPYSKLDLALVACKIHHPWAGYLNCPSWADNFLRFMETRTLLEREREKFL